MNKALDRTRKAAAGSQPASQLDWRRKVSDHVAFGLLVESGMVPAGARLMDSKRRWTASVNADGSITCEGQAGSIHKVGAALQGAPSCNGWTFWHVEEAGKLQPIDALRQKHLAAL